MGYPNLWGSKILRPFCWWNDPLQLNTGRWFFQRKKTARNAETSLPPFIYEISKQPPWLTVPVQDLFMLGPLLWACLKKMGTSVWQWLFETTNEMLRMLPSRWDHPFPCVFHRLGCIPASVLQDFHELPGCEDSPLAIKHCWKIIHLPSGYLT